MEDENTAHSKNYQSKLFISKNPVIQDDPPQLLFIFIIYCANASIK